MESHGADWDAEAARFDDEPDHGLRDPGTRTAWEALLRRLLPPAPARIADLGCGTGTLAVLLAEHGHRVSGVDLSPAMLDRAREKARRAGVRVSWKLGDASAPPLADGEFDVVLSRHVLWALPNPAAALVRWVRLLNDGGQLTLIEGRWSTGAGLTAAETTAHVRALGRPAELIGLDAEAYWGRPIEDERYVVVSRPSARSIAGSGSEPQPTTSPGEAPPV